MALLGRYHRFLDRNLGSGFVVTWMAVADLSVKCFDSSVSYCDAAYLLSLSLFLESVSFWGGTKPHTNLTFIN